MSTIIKDLYSIRPIWLSTTFILVALLASLLKNIEVSYGGILAFIAGFIYLLIIYIWPIVALVAMNSLTWKFKINIVYLTLISAFLISVTLMTLKTFFAFETSFFQESLWGNLFVVILSVCVVSCYASFYPLYLNGRNKWYHKFIAGYFSILLFVFSPFTIFYIKRKIDIFRTQQLCNRLSC